MGDKVTGVVLLFFVIFNVLRSIEYYKQIRRHIDDNYLNLKSSVAGNFIAGAANAMNAYCALLRSKNGFNEVIFFISLNALSCFVLFYVVWKAHAMENKLKHALPPEELDDEDI